MLEVVEPFLHSVLELQAPGSSSDHNEELKRALANIHALDISEERTEQALKRDEGAGAREKFRLRQRLEAIRAHRDSEQNIVRMAMRGLSK